MLLFSHSVVSDSFVTTWMTAHRASRLSLSPRVCSNVHRVDDAIQPSHPRHPLLLLPLIFPSIRVFSNELALCIRWPKYWSFSFSVSTSSEYKGLISFRTDCFDQTQNQLCYCTLTKKVECRRIDAFALWYWRRPLRVPWTERRSNQSYI